MELLGPLLTTSCWAHFACMFCGVQNFVEVEDRRFGGMTGASSKNVVTKVLTFAWYGNIWSTIDFSDTKCGRPTASIASGSAGRNSFSWQTWLQTGTCVAEVSWYDEAFSSRSSWPNCAVWVIDKQEIYKRNKTTTRLTNLKLSTLISWPWWWQLPQTNAAWRPKKAEYWWTMGDERRRMHPRRPRPKGAKTKHFCKAVLKAMVDKTKVEECQKLEALKSSCLWRWKIFQPSAEHDRIREPCPKNGMLVSCWLNVIVGQYASPPWILFRLVLPSSQGYAYPLRQKQLIIHWNRIPIIQLEISIGQAANLELLTSHWLHSLKLTFSLVKINGLEDDIFSIGASIVLFSGVFWLVSGGVMVSILGKS